MYGDLRCQHDVAGEVDQRDRVALGQDLYGQASRVLPWFQLHAGMGDVCREAKPSRMRSGQNPDNFGESIPQPPRTPDR